MSTSSTTSLTTLTTLTSRTNTKTTQDVALSTLTSATFLTTTSSTATAFPTAQSVTTSVKTTDQHGMVIGGVVGGIVGFLLLLGLALFLWFSRRKKPGEKVAAYPLVALGGLRSKREGRKRPGLATEGRAMNRPRSNTRNIKSPSPRTSTRTSPTRSPIKPSPTKPSPTTRAYPAGPADRLPLSRQSPISPLLSGRSPTATTIHSARSITPSISSSSTLAISPLTVFDRSLSINRSGTGCSTVSEKKLPPLPQHPALRPPTELPDTGFYRQRVELAACPSRELINRFDPRRQLSSEVNDFEDERQDGTVGAGGPPRTGPVVTADGVVLTANFERTSCGDDVLGSSGDSGPAHVMSFMQYDPEWNEVQPAYHPSWRRETAKLEKIEES
ncbi:hypothetical protein HFD88_003059 [Aspergillus terreus]|nr:hypothetical protein HFD88_003059 [Aspergillus terreus]